MGEPDGPRERKTAPGGPEVAEQGLAEQYKAKLYDALRLERRPREKKMASEPAGLPASFEAALKSEIWGDEFRAWATKQFLSESVEFVGVVDAYKAGPTWPRLYDIYDTYIAVDVPKQVNISAEQFAALRDIRATPLSERAGTEAPGRGVLNGALVDVKMLLADRYKSFCLLHRG